MSKITLRAMLAATSMLLVSGLATAALAPRVSASLPFGGGAEPRRDLAVVGGLDPAAYEPDAPRMRLSADAAAEQATTLGESPARKAAEDPAKKAAEAKAKATADAAAKASAKALASSPQRKRAPQSKNEQLQTLLAAQIRKYPILKGTTIGFGSTPGGAQAAAFYKEGRIVVSPNHRASLERIVAHEVWHVIDWRMNHRIDWYERIPPAYPDPR